MTVVANGGIDLIHLSRTAFPTMEAKRAVLQKITDFVESQPWSGPLFTRSADEEGAIDSSGAHPEKLTDDNSGWIEGTFSLDSLGMIGRNNYFDAPDLVVSFRELPDADNRGLTGPGAPTYVFDEHGEQTSGVGNDSRSTGRADQRCYVRRHRRMGRIYHRAWDACGGGSARAAQLLRGGRSGFPPSLRRPVSERQSRPASDDRAGDGSRVRRRRELRRPSARRGARRKSIQWQVE